MRGKLYCTFIFAVLVLFTGTAFAQTSPYNVTVTPEKAILEPGEGLQFEAQLFDAQGKAVQFNSFSWRVMPDSLGEISDDGYFVAGRIAGEVRVIAIMMRGSVRYYGEAVVKIGSPEPPLIKIIVTPRDAIVPPGDQQKFHVAAIARDNSNFKIDHVRWAVKPKKLGKIDRDGLFQAGDQIGQGMIIAFVDIDNAVYTGTARVTVSPRPTASISGQVKDESTGEPLVDSFVLVQRLGHIRWMRIARTDSAGNYVAGKLIPGLYVAKANAKDYLPEYYDGVSHLSEATPLQVSINDSLSGIDFNLGHGGSVSGFVATESDSLPIAHALVTATHVVTKRKRHAVTREDGSYILRSLPEGQYAISVHAAGYKGEFYDDATGLLNATLIPVTPPDSVKDINLYLATSSAIAGQVVDASDGAPIRHAVVRIYTLIGKRLHAKFTTVTDKNGDYLATVPPGFYLVHANAKGYRGEFFDNVTKFSDATPVQVFTDQHTTDINFDLVKLGSLSGVVTDETTNEPVADAIVMAFLERPTSATTASPADYNFKPFKARTDSAGHYRIKNLRPGKYFVMASARGYLPEFYQEAARLADATPVTVEDSSEVTGIDFTLAKGGIITGTVFDADDSTGIGGAAVTIWSEKTGYRRHVFTNRDGNYVIGGLPTGEYILFAKLRGYDGKFYDGVDSRDEATPVSVEAGQEVGGINFYLPKFQTRLGTIAGVVTTEPDSLSETVGGAPIAGALVVAIPIKRGPAHFDITDPFGNYRVTNLIPGEYLILAWAPGYIGEFYENVQDWRQATRVQAVANQITDGIDFALSEATNGPYRIRGVVKHGRGNNRKGVSGAVVYAFNEAGLVASAVTGSNGEFVMENLPAGRYKIRVSGVGMMTAYYGGSSEDAAQSVVLSDGQSAENIEIDAVETATGINENSSIVPQEFYLNQNYPNPFNPETSIKFGLPQKSHVTLRIYNVLGQVVRTLVDRQMEAGVHEMKWDGTTGAGQKVASGLYILRFEAGKVVQSRRMLLLK